MKKGIGEKNIYLERAKDRDRESKRDRKKELKVKKKERY